MMANTLGAAAVPTADEAASDLAADFAAHVAAAKVEAEAAAKETALVQLAAGATHAVLLPDL